MKKWLFVISIGVLSCTTENQNSVSSTNGDEDQIYQLHQDYVDGWKTMDEEKVMGLLEDESMIQPNRLKPIIGKENIRNFWFPHDSSITTINTFDTKVVSLNIRDSIAIMTHESLLDWDYKKDTMNFGMVQKGINTTIYRRQDDDQWKIWRSMWTDIAADSK